MKSRYPDVEFADLLQIRELLQHQYVVAAVVCLGDRQMRYGELGTAISEWTGNRVADGELTRTVRRLESGGLARSAYDGCGRRILSLTEDGRSRRQKIASLTRVLREVTHSNDADHR